MPEGPRVALQNGELRDLIERSTINGSRQATGRGCAVGLASAFLALSYTVGGPLTAFVEHQSQTLSAHFGLPPGAIYLTCLIQFLCGFGVLWPSTAFGSAMVLSVFTVGAIGAHLSVGTILDTLPAVFYTVLQVWFGIRVRAGNRRGGRGGE